MPRKRKVSFAPLPNAPFAAPGVIVPECKKVGRPLPKLSYDFFPPSINDN